MLAWLSSFVPSVEVRATINPYCAASALSEFSMLALKRSPVGSFTLIEVSVSRTAVVFLVKAISSTEAEHSVIEAFTTKPVIVPVSPVMSKE